MDDLLSAGFDQIFNLYNPLVYQTGDVLDTAIYRLGLVQHQYSMATAFGLFKSVISFILISSAYYLAYKIADYRIF
jgi:putative aldouronate transport system permease protein